ncbi:hypothetical protein TWF694_011303 [Orbilia ellipsospora]|uniref:Uncharacterized protein n=1 Tax=Orbilia ellipsospora TaxID=2528407 RepID=A0AAV9X571_9PEZI
MKLLLFLSFAASGALAFPNLSNKRGLLTCHGLCSKAVHSAPNGLADCSTYYTAAGLLHTAPIPTTTTILVTHYEYTVSGTTTYSDTAYLAGTGITLTVSTTVPGAATVDITTRLTPIFTANTAIPSSYRPLTRCHNSPQDFTKACSCNGATIPTTTITYTATTATTVTVGYDELIVLSPTGTTTTFTSTTTIFSPITGTVTATWTAFEMQGTGSASGDPSGPIYFDPLAFTPAYFQQALLTYDVSSSPAVFNFNPATGQLKADGTECKAEIQDKLSPGFPSWDSQVVTFSSPQGDDAYGHNGAFGWFYQYVDLDCTLDGATYGLSCASGARSIISYIHDDGAPSPAGVFLLHTSSFTYSPNPGEEYYPLEYWTAVPF